ncbi:hypothetical protein F3Y22_tig00110503pilonHSYRG00762 [Hibiscus syriacus]|uniref:Reverse transcriptase domain-containing protein n=1 Tax=Hibiscus syriacus TaxID=106335 RepID=A0A6A3AC34_HIBSY|nr:hypothetical protein F3Y22_tig00110503pilonHSYRG00762 [Hibiscus syriacus]
MKSKKLGRRGFFTLKLDMSKAYDWVEWSFIREVMLKIGFSQRWVSLIMSSVSTVSYSMVFNGVPGDSFLPSRGLRQGDPLSPYLFLFCAEGLSSLLHAAKSAGSLTGYKVGRYGENSTHLLFVDDSILFGEASPEGVAAMKDILVEYEVVSARVLKGRYFPNKSFMDADLGSYPSYAWRIIWCTRGFLQQGVGRRVVRGSFISIWNDDWLPGPDRVKALVNDDQSDTIIRWLQTPSWRGLCYVRRALLLAKSALPLPPKIKISCWRFFKNYITTAANLLNRRVNVSRICILCNIDHEIVAHLVQDCDYFHQVLTYLNLIIPPIPAEHWWILLLYNLFNALLNTQIKLFVVALWALWSYRNKRMHDNFIQSPWEFVKFIKNFMVEHDASNFLPVVHQRLNNDRWTPPSINWVKTNFDASFDLSFKSSISGIIIRNNDGLTMAVSSIPNQNIPNPEATKAWSYDRTEIRAIVSNVHKMARVFDNLSFSFVHRSQNAAAHAIAKDGRSFQAQMVWIEEAPLEIEAVVARDMWWVDPPD